MGRTNANAYGPRMSASPTPQSRRLSEKQRRLRSREAAADWASEAAGDEEEDGGDWLAGYSDVSLNKDIMENPVYLAEPEERRLSSPPVYTAPTPEFSRQISLLGYPSTDGFLLRISFRNCEAPVTFVLSSCDIDEWNGRYVFEKFNGAFGYGMFAKDQQHKIYFMDASLRWIIGEPGIMVYTEALSTGHDPLPVAVQFGRSCVIGQIPEPKCALNVIVVPSRASPNVGLPLSKVWPQNRRVECRVSGDGWAARVGNEIRWQAKGCRLDSGAEYSVFVHLESPLVNATQRLTFRLPPKPAVNARDLSLTDSDPNQGTVAGTVHLKAATDETDVLQYRVYWGRGAGQKVDTDLALFAVVNTFANGGFRSVFSNECLYNDCEWQMHVAQSTRRRTKYIIKHGTTGECFCVKYHNTMRVVCPEEVLMVNHPGADDMGGSYYDPSTEERPADCLWTIESKMIGGHVESRLENLRYAMCLCTVPVTRQYGMDGKPLPMKLGADARQLQLGRWCNTATWEVNGVTTRPTASYCEWTSRSPDPRPNGTMDLDAVHNQTQTEPLQFPPPTTAWGDLPAWEMQGEEGMDLSTPLLVPAEYTLAAWVDLRAFDALDPENDPGVVALFNATANETDEVEPCIVLNQRTAIDDTPPLCPLGICDLAETIRCCDTTTTTTTTTSTATSTTTTRQHPFGTMMTVDSNGSDVPVSNRFIVLPNITYARPTEVQMTLIAREATGLLWVTIIPATSTTTTTFWRLTPSTTTTTTTENREDFATEIYTKGVGSVAVTTTGTVSQTNGIMRFNGDGQVDTGIGMPPEQVKSIGCWVRIGADHASDGNYRMILTKSSANKGFEIALQTRKLRATLGGSGVHYLEWSTQLEYGEWYHVAAMHTGPGGRMSLHINGVEVGERDAPASIFDASGSWLIGSWAGGYRYFFGEVSGVYMSVAHIQPNHMIQHRPYADFRIKSLTPNCTAVEVANATGDDAGMVWSSMDDGGLVYLEGDKRVRIYPTDSTGLLKPDATPLGGAVRTGHIWSVHADPSTGRVYELRGAGREAHAGNLLDEIICLRSDTATTDTVIAEATSTLQLAITMKEPYTVFVGSGQMLVLDHIDEWYVITLGCGRELPVVSLGKNLGGTIEMKTCESGFQGGMFEREESRVTYAGKDGGVYQKIIPMGWPVQILDAAKLEDICSLSLNLANSRWYYHAERTEDHLEGLYSCEATIESRWKIGPYVSETLPGTVCSSASGSLEWARARCLMDETCGWVVDGEVGGEDQCLPSGRGSAWRWCGNVSDIVDAGLGTSVFSHTAPTAGYSCTMLRVDVPPPLVLPPVPAPPPPLVASSAIFPDTCQDKFGDYRIPCVQVSDVKSGVHANGGEGCRRVAVDIRGGEGVQTVVNFTDCKLYPDTVYYAFAYVEDAAYHQVAPGGGLGFGPDTTCSKNEDRRPVRCCSDSWVMPSGYYYFDVWTKRPGCDKWASSLQCQNLTFVEAQQMCHERGGRLCTKQEVMSGCVQGTGCLRDNRLIWTSDRCEESEHIWEEVQACNYTCADEPGQYAWEVKPHWSDCEAACNFRETEYMSFRYSNQVLTQRMRETCKCSDTCTPQFEHVASSPECDNSIFRKAPGFVSKHDGHLTTGLRVYVKPSNRFLQEPLVEATPTVTFFRFTFLLEKVGKMWAYMVPMEVHHRINLYNVKDMNYNIDAVGTCSRDDSWVPGTPGVQELQLCNMVKGTVYMLVVYVEDLNGGGDGTFARLPIVVPEDSVTNTFRSRPKLEFGVPLTFDGATITFRSEYLGRAWVAVAHEDDLVDPGPAPNGNYAEVPTLTIDDIVNKTSSRVNPAATCGAGGVDGLEADTTWLSIPLSGCNFRPNQRYKAFIYLTQGVPDDPNGRVSQGVLLAPPWTNAFEIEPHLQYKPHGDGITVNFQTTTPQGRIWMIIVPLHLASQVTVEGMRNTSITQVAAGGSRCRRLFLPVATDRQTIELSDCRLLTSVDYLLYMYASGPSGDEFGFMAPVVELYVPITNYHAVQPEAVLTPAPGPNRNLRVTFEAGANGRGWALIAKAESAATIMQAGYSLKDDTLGADRPGVPTYMESGCSLKNFVVHTDPDILVFQDCPLEYSARYVVFIYVEDEWNHNDGTMSDPVYVTIEDPPRPCTCTCPTVQNETSGDSGILSGHKWAVGLRACSSPALWDSGFDLSAPPGGGSGWTLIAAAGVGTPDGLGETTFYASEPQVPEIFKSEVHFGCSAPGCSATGYIRDLPRDALQHCNLAVEIRITDYRRGPTPEDPDPCVDAPAVGFTFLFPYPNCDARFDVCDWGGFARNCSDLEPHCIPWSDTPLDLNRAKAVKEKCPFTCGLCPQLVESISVSGSNPIRTRELKKDCFPDGYAAENLDGLDRSQLQQKAISYDLSIQGTDEEIRNRIIDKQKDRLVMCVRAHGVDDLITGPKAMRWLRIDARISPAVKEYPRNGEYLAGVATVTCKRIDLKDPYAPPSGALRKVGVAGRTCAGAMIRNLAASTGNSSSGPPKVYLGQAYMWDRVLNLDELRSLFHATRMRYYPEYDVQVIPGTGVSRDAAEVVVTQNMRCKQGACPVRATFKGLPVDRAATCVISVAVAITDFSDPSEVVEYIRLEPDSEAIDIVTNCWPGKDNEPETRYHCADRMDISMNTLNSQYLTDGEVVVEIQISSTVENFVTPRPNYDHLDADVEINCWGAEIAKKDVMFAGDSCGYVVGRDGTSTCPGETTPIVDSTECRAIKDYFGGEPYARDLDSFIVDQWDTLFHGDFTPLDEIDTYVPDGCYSWSFNMQTARYTCQSIRRRSGVTSRWEEFKCGATPVKEFHMDYWPINSRMIYFNRFKWRKIKSGSSPICKDKCQVLDEHGTRIEPETLEVIAVAASDQGEGPMATTPFNDVVNSFKQHPVLRRVPENNRLKIDLELLNNKGAVWIFVVAREIAEAGLTPEEIMDGLPGKDHCPNSDRRRQASRRRRGGEEFETRMEYTVPQACNFEPTVPYSLIIYVDRTDPPYGGGTIGRVDFDGPMPPVKYDYLWNPIVVPVLRASSIEFEDTNPAMGVLTGTVTVGKAYSESDIVKYEIYFGQNGRMFDPNNEGPIAVIPTTGAELYYATITDLEIPFGANTLIIFSCGVNFPFYDADLWRTKQIIDMSHAFIGTGTIDHVEPFNDPDGMYYELNARMLLGSVSFDAAIAKPGLEDDLYEQYDGELKVLSYQKLKTNLACVTDPFLQMDPTATDRANGYMEVTARIGPCQLEPGERYRLILHSASREVCPNGECGGQTLFTSQGIAGSGILTASDNTDYLSAGPGEYIVPPDRLFPRLAAYSLSGSACEGTISFAMDVSNISYAHLIEDEEMLINMQQGLKEVIAMEARGYDDIVLSWEAVDLMITTIQAESFLMEMVLTVPSLYLSGVQKNFRRSMTLNSNMVHSLETTAKLAAAGQISMVIGPPLMGGCPGDTTLQPRFTLKEPGRAYPAKAICAACRSDPPACVRAGEMAHTYWRIRIPQGKGSDMCLSPSGVDIAEIFFYAASDRNADGARIVGIQAIPGAFVIHGGTSLSVPGEMVDRAFDGNPDTGYKVKTQGDAWFGLNFAGTPDGKIRLHRVRVVWGSNLCAASEMYLEWSDDNVNWNSWGEAKGPATNKDEGSRFYHDVILHKDMVDMYGTPSWWNGVLFGTFFPTEGNRKVKIEGLVPGTDYDIHCYSEDAIGNGGNSGPFPARTTDTTAPILEFHGAVEVTDFSVTPKLTVSDPGENYPAFTNCFIQEPKAPAALLDPPFDVDNLDGDNLRCHTVSAPAAPDSSGRIIYRRVFGARVRRQPRNHTFMRNTWGGSNQDVMRSCGLRHQAALGKGGCAAMGGELQKAELSVMVLADQDVSVFIGEGGKAGQGYEVTFGGWNNRMSVIRRGASSGYVNADQKWPTILATHDAGDEGLLTLQKYRNFWISIDPNSGWISVGEGSSFRARIMMEIKDNDPYTSLDEVYVGAGYRSAGLSKDANGIAQGGLGGADFVVCPRQVNLALNHKAFSSSVAFEGTPDKMVDGQVGDNTFCEYCRASDSRHVCAATRKGTRYRPPWIRVQWTTIVQIFAIRLVVPMDGLPGQRHVQVWVGPEGYRSEGQLCKDIQDAGGDHVHICNQVWNAGGAMVYGIAEDLADLPDAFGLRVCELEVYQHLTEVSNPTFAKTHLEKKMWTSEPDILTPGLEPSPVTLKGLRPNVEYELFCYGEDASGNGRLSEKLTVRTTDTTAPTVNIIHVQSSERTITVNVTVDDPGESYPVAARCAATHKGLTPQEHDLYFEHRYWRMVVEAPPETMEESCGGIVRLRSAELLAHDGEPLQGWAGEVVYSEGYEVEPELGPTMGVPPTAYDEQANFHYEDLGMLGLLTWVEAAKTEGHPDLQEIQKAAGKISPEHASPIRAPLGISTITVDMKNARNALEKRILRKGGSVRGDLVIGMMWDTEDSMSLQIMPPTYVWYMTRENESMAGGKFDAFCAEDHCDPKVESASFTLALPGVYQLAVARRWNSSVESDWATWDDVPVKIGVQVCGIWTFYEAVMPGDTDNMTMPTPVVFEHTGCHRDGGNKTKNDWRDRSSRDWKSWVSNVLDPIYPLTTPEPPDDLALYGLEAPTWPQPPAWWLTDNNMSTCAETGGRDRPTPDDEPWVRVDLGQVMRVQGVWLAGELIGGRYPYTASTVADIYVVEANETMESLGFLKIPYDLREWIPKLPDDALPTEGRLLGEGEDSLKLEVQGGEIGGIWLPNGPTPAVAVRRTYAFEATNTSAFWIVCGVNANTLLCIEINVFPDFEGNLRASVNRALFKGAYSKTVEEITEVEINNILDAATGSDASMAFTSTNADVAESENGAGFGVSRLRFVITPVPRADVACAYDVKIGSSADIGFKSEPAHRFAPANGSLPDPGCAWNMDIHSVRCCNDKQIDESWRRMNDCPVYVDECIPETITKHLTFAEAEDYCKSKGVGSRLCTEREVMDKCAQGSGRRRKPCPVDPLSIWVSDVCLVDQNYVFETRKSGWLTLYTRSKEAPYQMKQAWHDYQQGDMTWEGWFKVTVPHPYGANLLGSWGSGFNTDKYVQSNRRRHGTLWYQYDGKLRMTGSIGLFPNLENEWDIEGPAAPKDEWFHVAVIWSKTLGYAKVVLNGEELPGQFPYVPDGQYLIADDEFVIGGGSYRRDLGIQVSHITFWNISRPISSIRMCAVQQPREGLYAVWTLRSSFLEIGGLIGQELEATLGGVGGTVPHFTNGKPAEPCEPNITVTNPPRVHLCKDAPDGWEEGIRGAHLLIRPRVRGIALSVCELGVFTRPLWTATRAKIQFSMGFSNETQDVCGSQKFSVEWSDDNETWTRSWTRMLNPESLEEQHGNWSWWDRLFMLDWTTEFPGPGTNSVEIPQLRENVTYDVYCWATDSAGNGGNNISQELVSLPLPWAETHTMAPSGHGEATEFGARRLAESGESGVRRLKQVDPLRDANTKLWCTPELREKIACEDAIVTNDQQPPILLSSRWARFDYGFDPTHDMDPTLRGYQFAMTWDVQLADVNCQHRQFYTVKCLVRCAALDTGVVLEDWRPFADAGDEGLDCQSAAVEQKWYPVASGAPAVCADGRWSNEKPLQLVFLGLKPLTHHKMVCQAEDPMGNRVEWTDVFRTPYPPTTTETTVTTATTTTSRPWGFDGPVYTPPPSPPWEPEPPPPPPPGPVRRRRRSPVVNEEAPQWWNPTPVPGNWMSNEELDNARDDAVGDWDDGTDTGGQTTRPAPAPAPPADDWEWQWQSPSPSPGGSSTAYTPAPTGYNYDRVQQSGPKVMRIGVALGFASAADANKMTRPGPSAAVADALRATLQLRPDDEIEVVDASVKEIAAPRRLSDAAGTGSTWEVRLAYEIRTSGGIHASSVVSKIEALQSGDAGMANTLQTALVEELESREIQIATPEFRQAALALQASEGSGDTTQQTTTQSGWGSFGTQKTQTSGVKQVPQSDDGTSKTVIMAVATLLLLFAFVIPVSAGCAWFLMKRYRLLSDDMQQVHNAPPKRSSVVCASTVAQSSSPQPSGMTPAAGRYSHTGPAVVIDPSSKRPPNSQMAVASKQHEPTVCQADTRPGTPFSTCSTAINSGNSGNSSGHPPSGTESLPSGSALESSRIRATAAAAADASAAAMHAAVSPVRPLPAASSPARIAASSAAGTPPAQPPPVTPARGSVLSTIRQPGGRPAVTPQRGSAGQAAMPPPPQAQNLFPEPPRAEAAGATWVPRPRGHEAHRAVPASAQSASRGSSAGPTPQHTARGSSRGPTPQHTARGAGPQGLTRSASATLRGAAAAPPGAHGAAAPRGPRVLGSMATQEELDAMNRGR
eukprot:TRINITY_DN8778_c0_g1_i1.p1 TRINITY_DN8778_c0_g1~~TRINITY_DN8778_c0_g1_i1.p1  ORF type:complete len:6658 (+),score=1287.90 TRINITY_DN8778_c0_g1_i1:1019-19975(+)